METSEKFGFKLPSSNADDIADINQISDNFRVIDETAVTEQRLEDELFPINEKLRDVPSNESVLQLTKELIGYAEEDFDEKYASAIRNAISGTAVILDDISPLKHTLEVKATSDGVDVSTANIKRFGKNSLNIADALPITPETVSIEGDNIVLKNFGANHYGIKFTENLNLEVGKTYTFSIKGITAHSTGGWGWRVTYQDGTQEELKKPPATYTIKKEVRTIGFYVAFGDMTVTQDIIISKPQIELGTKETEYEPFKEPTIHSINADGTVEGVTSLYPTTTLIPDIEGVVLEVEYNVDTKKYIDNEISRRIAETMALVLEV